MFCHNCGEEIKEEWRVCPKCGVKLTDNELNNEEPDIAESKIMHESSINEGHTKKENSKIICIIGLLIVVGIGIALFWNHTDNKSDSDDNMKSSNIEKVENTTEKNADQKTQTDFYPTDVIDCGNWEATIWIDWMSYNDILGNEEVNCLCDFTNKSGKTQIFNTADIFELNNKGIIVEGYSEFDGQKIANGTKFRTTVTFGFPQNSNNMLTLMKICTNGKNVFLTPKPQSKEDIKKFAGTYENGSSKMVFVEQSPNVYQLFEYNSFLGVEERTITMDKNYRFRIGGCGYIWLPEESALYTTDVDGNPDRESYYYTKSNYEIIETVPVKELQVGELYYSTTGITISIEKNGNIGYVVAYVLLDGDKAQIVYKGQFDYNDDMANPVDVDIDEEYYSDECDGLKISFPDGIDGKIVLYFASSDEKIEYYKE